MMKAGRRSREAAAFAAKFAQGQGQGQGYRDPFNLFGARPPPHAAPVRNLGKIERNALSELDLDEAAAGP